MKATHAWHDSLGGRIARFLGSIQLAVPVLVLTAAALAVGTYLDSTEGSKIAKAVVYASWWFLGLMGLVCVSLVFAVVTRYPWKRKHIGFIVVHASLITLISGGFWSMFGRVEGHLALKEGTSGSAIETDSDRLELLEHNDGQFITVASIPAPDNPGTFNLGGTSVQVLERWDNTRDEESITDDGPAPFRAVEMSFDPNAASGTWLGEETKTGGPATYDGMTVRLLGDGSTWDPPAPAAAGSEPQYAFLVGETRYPLAEEGKEVFPGWTITSIRRFKQAMVSDSGLSEGSGGKENPAVEVVISNGRGTSERHSAFRAFPDMVMSKVLEGPSSSGARLAPVGLSTGETLVLYGAAPGVKVGYVAPDGSVLKLEHDGTFPWAFDVGKRHPTILRQFTRVRASSHVVRAEPSKQSRPALLLRAPGASELTVAAWKDLVDLPDDKRHLVVRYGPGTVPLPFTVQLNDFRKQDYPGTDMAMSYESDVTVTDPSGGSRPFRIYMNNPYHGAGWKVYQSGFSMEDGAVSIFSVMKDPGLPLTYIGAIGLVGGILITFYSRGMSWGHPGIPVAFTESSHAPSAPRTQPPAVALAGVGASPAVDGPSRLDPGAGRRPDDAAGLVRAAAGGPAHR